MFCPRCGIENPETGKFCRSCGADLSNVLAAIEGTLPPAAEISGDSNFAELYSTGVRNTILGAGFLVTSVFLFTLPGNTLYWLVTMIPAFFLIASGVSRIVKSDAIKNTKKVNTIQQPIFSLHQANKTLPPNQTDYVKPQKPIYETDELHGEPLSITEDTTRHLEMNIEGEMMTLPNGEK